MSIKVRSIAKKLLEFSLFFRSLEDRSIDCAHHQPFTYFFLPVSGKTPIITSLLKSLYSLPEHGQLRSRSKRSILLVTLFQEDINALVAWINHYKEFGVSDFLIGYNGKAPRDILEYVMKTRGVVLVDWDMPYAYHGSCWGKLSFHFAQPAFLQWSQVFAEREGFQWFLTVDLDEFIVFPKQFSEIDLTDSSREIVFENVWARKSLAAKRTGVLLASSSLNEYSRRKSLKKVGAFRRIMVHESMENSNVGGWFLHFDQQTPVNFGRAELDGWVEVADLEVLGTMNFDQLKVWLRN